MCEYTEPFRLAESEQRLRESAALHAPSAAEVEALAEWFHATFKQCGGCLHSGIANDQCRAWAHRFIASPPAGYVFNLPKNSPPPF